MPDSITTLKKETDQTGKETGKLEINIVCGTGVQKLSVAPPIEGGALYCFSREYVIAVRKYGTISIYQPNKSENGTVELKLVNIFGNVADLHEVTAVTILPGNYLAVGRDNGKVEIWDLGRDLESQKPINICDRVLGSSVFLPVQFITAQLDGKQTDDKQGKVQKLMVRYSDNKVIAWPWTKQQISYQVLGGEPGKLAVTKDGQGKIMFWNLKCGKPLTDIKTQDLKAFYIYSPVSSVVRVVIGYANGEIIIYNADGTQIDSIQAPEVKGTEIYALTMLNNSELHVKYSDGTVWMEDIRKENKKQSGQTISVSPQITDQQQSAILEQVKEISYVLSAKETSEGIDKVPKGVIIVKAGGQLSEDGCVSGVKVSKTSDEAKVSNAAAAAQSSSIGQSPPLEQPASPATVVACKKQDWRLNWSNFTRAIKWFLNKVADFFVGSGQLGLRSDHEKVQVRSPSPCNNSLLCFFFGYPGRDSIGTPVVPNVASVDCSFNTSAPVTVPPPIASPGSK